MNTPRISVLLPVYNAEPYLREAVRSVQRQSFGDLEILILDDASTDGSENIAAQIASKDSRFRHLRSGENKGLSRQLNIGIDLARGEFIARMDADDIALPARFERQISTFERSPEIGICGCLVDEITADGNESGYRWELPAAHDHISSLQFIRCGFNHPSVMIRGSVLKEHALRYREDFEVAQDYELWIRLLQLTEGCNLQQPLMKYRRFPSQLSQASAPRKLEEVSLIRKGLRSSIGLDENGHQHEMHQRFCDDHWPRDIGWFNEMINWLNGVYQSNLQTNAFPSSAFAQLLANRLYLQCYMATGRGFNGAKVFQRAAFRRHAQVGAKQRLKVFVRSCLR